MNVIAALYKFVRIADTAALKDALTFLLKGENIKGTIIVAQEGINGTVAGTRLAIDQLKSYLAKDERFLGMEYKESFAPICPFKRLKVKIKQEIVTLGCEGIDPVDDAGVLVDAQQWNALLSDPEVTIIDVRNDFEVALGSFENAVNPNTKNFGEFPRFVDKHLSPSTNKKIAMACTGGIRCEKASSYLKQVGFQTVYQLKGGILQYLRDTPKEESKWRGQCFVFDERIALNHDLAPARNAD